MKHILGLLALVLLVAYFGVWRGSETVAEELGTGWGIAAAALSLAGLAIIAVAGSIVVQTMRAMAPGAGVEGKKARNQPD